MITFFRQLWGELVKMSARKRTYIGFGCFIAAEVVLAFLLHRPGAREFFRKLLENGGFSYEHFWSGLSVAYFIVAWTTFLLGGNFLALVLGDIVAKETEEGSFRLLLSRPISRFRILALKYLAGMIYTFVLVGFIALSCFGVGVIDRGWGGGLFVWSDELALFEVYSDFAEGAKRYALAAPFLATSTLTVSSIAFMFSCFKIKPAAATILSVSIMVVDMILTRLPFAASYREFSLINHMAVYAKIYEHKIPWMLLARDYLFLFGINASCFIVGWYAFQRRDFKS